MMYDFKKLLLLGNFVAVTASFAGTQPPNIIIFFSDDHTQQAISAYQNDPAARPQDRVFKDWAPAQTPNIDRLADNGVLFRNSYVCNSICGPSRASLLTGLHSHANGFLGNQDTFDGSQQTVPKLLQAAGYDTSFFGKWHLKSEPTGFDHYERLVGQGAYYSPMLRTTLAGGGLSDIQYTGDYVADVITDQAVDWLQDRIDSSATNAFLMFVNHKGPHRWWLPSPVETDPAVFRLVEWDYSVTPNPDTAPGDPASWTPSVVPVPPTFLDRDNNYSTRADGARLQAMEVASNLQLNQDLKLTSTFGGTAYDEVRTWWNANSGGMSEAEQQLYYLQRYLKDYMLTAKGTDRGVGELLDFLEANHLDHNTIIIYSSDQGFFLGEHGWFDKRWMYEESFRTPLVMQWKDENGASLIAPGSRIDEMVQVMDFGPTVLEAAEVSIPEPMHGESFLGYVTSAVGDEPATWRDALYYHYHEGISGAHNVRKHYGILDGRYKLIFQYEGNQWEFFDLQTDPMEVTNLLYNAATGTIDDPTDGVEGTEAFQNLVIDHMIALQNLREQYGDSSGLGFTIPGRAGNFVSKLLVGLPYSQAVYDTSQVGETNVPVPALPSGLTFHIAVRPVAEDLSGTVLLMEIGGNSNGSGLYLIDGVPSFIQKQNSSDAAVPVSVNDTELPEVCVQSGFGALSAHVDYQVVVVYAPPGTGTVGTLELAVHPQGAHALLEAFSFSNDSAGGDWSGNETLSVGIDPGGKGTGGLSTTAGVFHAGSLKDLSGEMARALYWNAIGPITGCLEIEHFVGVSTQVELSFSGGIQGRTYRLMRSTELPPGTYGIAVDALVAGVGPDLLVDDGNPDALPTNHAFYAVQENAE